MAELAEGARLLSECAVKTAPRVRIPLSPPENTVGLDGNKLARRPETFEKRSILFKVKNGEDLTAGIH